jgi:hypothetical protein
MDVEEVSFGGEFACLVGGGGVEQAAGVSDFLAHLLLFWLKINFRNSAYRN